jgi:hypothetical protein
LVTGPRLIGVCLGRNEKRQPASPYEMVDAIEPHQAYHDEVEGDDVVQQPRHDQDQNAGEKGDDRRDMTDGEMHFKLLESIELATIGTRHSCTAIEGNATASTLSPIAPVFLEV